MYCVSCMCFDVAQSFFTRATQNLLVDCTKIISGTQTLSPVDCSCNRSRQVKLKSTFIQCCKLKCNIHVVVRILHRCQLLAPKIQGESDIEISSKSGFSKYVARPTSYGFRFQKEVFRIFQAVGPVGNVNVTLTLWDIATHPSPRCNRPPHGHGKHRATENLITRDKEAKINRRKTNTHFCILIVTFLLSP